MEIGNAVGVDIVAAAILSEQLRGKGLVHLNVPLPSS